MFSVLHILRVYNLFYIELSCVALLCTVELFCVNLFARTCIGLLRMEGMFTYSRSAKPIYVSGRGLA